MLKIEDVHIGTFTKGLQFEGYTYFAVAQLVDKTHIVTAGNDYRRDTSQLMHVPILDDDPKSGDFCGAMKRMLQKALPNQKCFYHQMPKDGTLSRQVIGENKIRDLHKSAANWLGISKDMFRGGHAWRHLLITNMVNSKGVSNAESMTAARHKLLSAHIRYQETDIVSEGKRTIALLKKYNPAAAAAFGRTKNPKQNLQPDNIQPPASKLQESSSKDTSEACSL